MSRKKILLRLLAAREAARLGIELEPDRLGGEIDALRRRIGLASDEALEDWLREIGVGYASFQEFGRDLALVEMLETRLDSEIVPRLGLQRGLQALLAGEGAERWIQVDVELARGEGGPEASAAELFERLLPCVAPDRRTADLHGFFLTRKPPDLRIRLSGPDPRSLADRCGAILGGLQRSGHVVEWHAVPYEPERFRFGSSAELAVVHRWFEADSLGWMRWEPLAVRRSNRLSREVLSLAVLNDLFASVLGDGAEIWDVWCRLALLHDIPLEGESAEVPPVRTGPLKECSTQAEGEVLEGYEHASRETAAALQELARAGDLLRGPRGLLADLALFHWNRFGLTPEARRRIVGPMLRAFDPRV